MPTQEACSPTYLRGFINIAGNITTQSFTTQSNIAPFTASFAPRNIAPTLFGNYVNETNQNTLLYNSYRYTLVRDGTQFAKPSHVGLVPQNIRGTPVFELIFTYGTTQPIKEVSVPNVILLVVPIFISAESNHAAYVRQFIDSDKYPAASIQTVFFENKNDKTQSSIAYNTSIQITNSEKKPTRCLSMKVFYYPNGIHLNGQDFNSFNSILTNTNGNDVRPYFIPYSLIGDNPIATDYDPATNQITSISTTYNVPISQISVAEIGNKIEYFQLPMSLSGTKDFTSSCPYYRTDQYKCVPFHRLTDLSGNQVIKNANTLADVLKEQDAVNNEGPSINVKWVFVYMGIAIGIVLLILVLGWGLRWMQNATSASAAAATAAAAAATAATAAIITPIAATPPTAPAATPAAVPAAAPAATPPTAPPAPATPRPTTAAATAATDASGRKLAQGPTRPRQT